MNKDIKGDTDECSCRARYERNKKRKNVIYSPIYDELIKLARVIEMSDKYPVEIFFGKKESYRPNGAPAFDAWERIKEDVRFIEVPTYLANQLEDFQASGKKYVQSRIEASERIYQQIRVNIEDTELIEHIDMYQRSSYDFFLDYFLRNTYGMQKGLKTPYTSI